jgi:hypothetical protein
MITDIRESFSTLCVSHAALLVRGFFPKLELFADFLDTYIINLARRQGTQRPVMPVNEPEKKDECAYRTARSAAKTHEYCK